MEWYCLSDSDTPQCFEALSALEAKWYALLLTRGYKIQRINHPEMCELYLPRDRSSQRARVAAHARFRWNKVRPCRSTSVGDIVQVGDKLFIVAGRGFDLIPSGSNNPSFRTSCLKVPAGGQIPMLSFYIRT